MTAPATVGFYLGKFAPFHAGHQHVIEVAQQETDHVVVLIYPTDVIDVPLSVRADWIRDLYPAVEVVEAWTGPTETGTTPRLQARHERYARDRLRDAASVEPADITHFYSAEPYGAHMAAGLGAVDRRLDRTAVPVSGTAIRGRPHHFRDYVANRVYRDLITNVALVGGPSTGKSTLAEALAEAYDTEWMPEYGREYWEAHQTNRRLTQGQLVDLAMGHLKREDQHLERAREVLFTDTNAITTYVFSQYYHGDAHPVLEALAARCGARYDHIVVCGTDIPYADTWDRSGPTNRERLQRQTTAFLDRHQIPYTTVTGPVDERVAAVQDVLAPAVPRPDA